MTRKSVSVQKLDNAITGQPDALIPQKHGGKLRAGGKPGHNGKNAGRPTKAYQIRRQEIRNQLLRGFDAKKAAETMHPIVVPMLRYCSEFEEGRPEQRVSLKGGVVLSLRKASE